MSAPVVVGVDHVEHNPQFDQLIAVAVREARIRKAAIRLVHVYRWIPPTALGAPMDDAATEDAVRQAVAVPLETAAAKLRELYPDVVIETLVAGGDAARRLAEAAEHAALLVVGGRGRGGFTGQLLGSVSLRAVALAGCPVLVVRGEPTADTGRVMVGVDIETPVTGAETLDFAFAEAELRGGGVYAVHVWDDPTLLYLPSAVRFAPSHSAEMTADRKQRLDAVLAPWDEKYPDMRVSREVFPGSPSRFLVESTRTVDLLVLGARAAADGGTGVRVGALAHTVLHHSHCPVVIVPEH